MEVLMATIINETVIENNTIVATSRGETIDLGDYADYLTSSPPIVSIYGRAGRDEIYYGSDLDENPGGFFADPNEIRAYFYGEEGDDFMWGLPAGITEGSGGEGFDRFTTTEEYYPTNTMNYYLADGAIIFERQASAGKFYAMNIIKDDIEVIGTDGVFLLTEELRKGVVRYIDSDELSAYKQSWLASQQATSSGAPDQSTTTQTQESTTDDQTISITPISLSNLLTGKSAKSDSIIGTDESDTIGAGKGVDRLQGKGSADKFVFNQKDKLGKKGADIITDFNASEGDAIAINPSALPGLRSAEFGVATSRGELNLLYTKSANIIYYQPTGQLIYDQNGSGKGFGKGGIFAILQGSPELSAEDLGIF